MRLILQRVSSAEVRVEGAVVGRIGPGALVLVGVERNDGSQEVAAATKKLVELRFFEDDAGRMNLDSKAAGAEFLIVSQFTLAASVSKGRRPSFSRAAPSDVAEPLVEELIINLRRHGFEVATGRFGAKMEVALINDGPVTFVIDIPFERRS
ncbi:MAG: D-aminoacyl-tRNA deacylase [Thermoanaerobaculia bacterium]